MDEIKQPELLGQDKRGNVRPADDRFLSTSQKRKRDAYVTKVEEATADAAAAAATEPADDPLATILTDAVSRALTVEQPDETTGGTSDE